MPRYIALLRGINVGGHRVKMDRLRSLFAGLGFGDVRTVIASGNVLFTSTVGDERALVRQIAAHLEKELGFPVPTILRTPAELREALAFGAAMDVPDNSDSSLQVLFFAEPLTPDVRRRMAALETPRDRFECAGREAFWVTAGRLSDSKVFKAGLGKIPWNPGPDGAQPEDPAPGVVPDRR